MIGKKIKNPRKSASKAVRIGRLLDYVRNPETVNRSGKCIYSGARGFLTERPQSQKAEMLALSEEAVRSKDTINHYVLSWQEGEHPGPEHVEEAVSLFMKKLGLDGHQVVYALHADTGNIHLHLVINRVHPDSLKVIKPSRGFDIEAVHRAIAVIEYLQGWQREHNGRYDGEQVLAHKEVDKEVRPTCRPDRPRQPGQTKGDMERRTGEKSAERIAIEDGAPVIRSATSWQELHRRLAEIGMRYEMTGSGASLFVGDVQVKASSAHPGASLPRLQKRLGMYEPSSQSLRLAERAPEPIRNDIPGWETYITGRKAHHAAQETARVEQKSRQEAEYRRLAEDQRARREEVLTGNWRGRGTLRNTTQSILAAGQAAEKAALKERHKAEREQLRQQYRPYPDLEQWQQQHRPGDFAGQRWHQASEPPHIEGDGTEQPTPRDIRDYVWEVRDQQVHYTKIEKAGLGGRAAFVDRGRVIDIYDWCNRDSVLAALQLSRQKWGSFRVTGNDEYKAMCVRLAAEHGFRISNPELKERIQQERQRIQLQRAPAMKPEPLPQFEVDDGPGMG